MQDLHQNIPIGKAYGEWELLRQKNNFRSHEDLAFHLLNWWRENDNATTRANASSVDLAGTTISVSLQLRLDGLLPVIIQTRRATIIQGSTRPSNCCLVLSARNTAELYFSQPFYNLTDRVSVQRKDLSHNVLGVEIAGLDKRLGESTGMESTSDNYEQMPSTRVEFPYTSSAVVSSNNFTRSPLKDASSVAHEYTKSTIPAGFSDTRSASVSNHNFLPFKDDDELAHEYSKSIMRSGFPYINSSSLSSSTMLPFTDEDVRAYAYPKSTNVRPSGQNESQQNKNYHPKFFSKPSIPNNDFIDTESSSTRHFGKCLKESLSKSYGTCSRSNDAKSNVLDSTHYVNRSQEPDQTEPYNRVDYLHGFKILPMSIGLGNKKDCLETSPPCTTKAPQTTKYAHFTSASNTQNASGPLLRTGHIEAQKVTGTTTRSSGECDLQINTLSNSKSSVAGSLKHHESPKQNLPETRKEHYVKSDEGDNNPQQRTETACSPSGKERNVTPNAYSVRHTENIHTVTPSKLAPLSATAALPNIQTTPPCHVGQSEQSIASPDGIAPDTREKSDMGDLSAASDSDSEDTSLSEDSSADGSDGEDSDVDKSSAATVFKYQCLICLYSCPLLLDMKTHMKLNHPEVESAFSDVTRECPVISSDLDPLVVGGGKYGQELAQMYESYVDPTSGKPVGGDHPKYKPYVQMEKQGNKSLFRCKACHFLYESLKALKIHVCLAHLKDGYRQPELITADKEEHNIGKFKSKKAKAERSFVCEQCGVRFSTSTRRDDHMFIKHDRDLGRTFPCGLCDKVFQTTFQRKNHKKQDHGAPTVCPIKGCGQIMKKNSLPNHMVNVHKERNFACEICGKLFPTRSKLNAHSSVVHLKQRDWICTYPGCQKRFGQRWHLKVHMRIHTGEKPMQCEFCGFTGRQLNSLRSHMKTHHKEMAK